MRRGRNPQIPRALTEEKPPPTPPLPAQGAQLPNPMGHPVYFQTHAFQAEVAELLNLMVHSVYSETDVFLRELISNASDACDKLRYEAISNPGLLAGDERLVIRLTPDAKAGTLALADTGIGMTEQE